jgi:serine/threonine protein kinase/Tfp pilus assembly protein PilF
VEPFAKEIKQFKILEPIGKGGMGEVFLAYDTILERKVAIKFLPEGLQDDIAFQERFFREAKAAAALDHPFICKIYETGNIQGRAYIVMEYIEGESLMAQMAKEPLSLKDSFRITSEIAEALEKAHEDGIVHRDLKPGNIMITPQGHVKIMDFGLAKKVPAGIEVRLREGKGAFPGKDRVPSKMADDITETLVYETRAAAEDTERTVILDSEEDKLKEVRVADISKVALQSSLTQYGTVVGTLAYMSPEQARGDTVDVRSDIFALGVILYEMIAKKHPFLRSDSAKTMDAIVNNPPPPLKIKPKKLASALTPILRKALAKDVAHRYQNVKDFSLDLQKMQKVLHIGSPLFYLSRPAMISLAALLTVIMAGTFWLARRGRISTAELGRKPVSVLVADFQNLTGDIVFDGALEQAVDIGLEGASFISLYQRSEARKIAAEVFPESGGRLDSQTAQLISAREGITKFIEGSIEPKGGGFELSVKVRNPVNPEDVKEYSRKAKSKNDVLNAAAWIANKARSGLGDVSADPKKALRGETYTTSSLVAMSAYTKAQELYREGKDEDSVAEYLRAIKEDPDFGRAYAALALVYQNRGQYEEAERYFQEALSRIDRMSGREKLRTRAIYYLIKRNFQQAIKECSEWVEKYPADEIGFSNLALAYFYARNFASAKEMGQRAVELNPRKIQTRFNLSWYALAASDFKVAAQEAQGIIKDNPGFYEVYVVLALAHLAQGEVSEAVRIYEELRKINPIGESLAALGLADLALYEGRLSSAMSILEEQLAKDKKEGRTDYVGNKWSLLAEARLLSGKTALAIKAADQAVASSKDLASMFTSAVVYIQADREAKALGLAEELEKRLESEPRAYANLIKGELKKKNGQIQEAITQFQEAQGILDSWIGRCILGKAFLEIKAYPDAHSLLDSCLTHKGEAASVFFDDTPTYHVVASMYYYIGRAQEGLGSLAAKESYQKFLAIKAKTDWDDPLVKDARRRLATL